MCIDVQLRSPRRDGGDHRLGLNAANQRAALSALRIGPSIAKPMLAAYQVRRDLIVKRIAELDTLDAHGPREGFYLFARYRADRPSTEMVRLLLEGVCRGSRWQRVRTGGRGAHGALLRRRYM